MPGNHEDIENKERRFFAWCIFIAKAIACITVLAIFVIMDAAAICKLASVEFPALFSGKAASGQPAAPRGYVHGSAPASISAGPSCDAARADSGKSP